MKVMRINPFPPGEGRVEDSFTPGLPAPTPLI